MHVFLSAAPEARPFCLPSMISGFEAEVADALTEIPIEAVRVTVGSANAGETTEPDTAPVEAVSLVARPTGRRHRGMPWWEVVKA